RVIVRPVALKGFERKMREDRGAYEEHYPMTPEIDEAWTKYLKLGEAVLNRYFDWATTADDFDSILADEDIWTAVPDPDAPENDLGSVDRKREIRYFGRVDQVMSTPDDEYWVVDHRIVWDEFSDENDLLDDPRTLLGQRALELAYPQLRIAGTVYNELRVGRDELEGAAPSPEPAGEDIRDHSKGARHLNFRRVASAIESKYTDDGSDHVIQREGNDYVRRTYITRSRATLEPISRQMAADAILVRDSDIEIYPDPEPEKCAACRFATPCVMLDQGLDISAVMAANFRRRTDEEFDEEGLRFSPRRQAYRASLGGVQERMQNASKWRGGNAT
ncbi:MAG TPA: hypothetical protein VM942_03020, partial [Acidimicrobiales bacterium]|nr:hypothetical protein [Acidimicrobiales bacterium]